MNIGHAKELLVTQGLLPYLSRRQAEIFLQRLLWSEVPQYFTSPSLPEVSVVATQRKIYPTKNSLQTKNAADMHIHIFVPNIPRNSTINWPGEFVKQSKAVEWIGASSAPHFCSVMSKPRPVIDDNVLSEQYINLQAIKKWLTPSPSHANSTTITQWLDQITSEEYIQQLFVNEFGWNEQPTTWSTNQHALVELTHNIVIHYFNSATITVKREYTQDEHKYFPLKICTYNNCYSNDLNISDDYWDSRYVLRWWLNHLHHDGVTRKDNRMSNGRLAVPPHLTSMVQERYLAYTQISGTTLVADAFHRFAMEHDKITSYPDISPFQLP